MNEPVSVIIPIFNNENTIRATVESVINQTYKNFEIIIVNDGSTDNSDKVVKEIINGYNYPIIYYEQPNKGPSAARNKGVELSNYDYIAFLDGDDLWHPQKLEIQLKVFVESQDVIDFVCGGSTFNKEDLEVEIKNYKIKKINYKNLIKKNFICTQTVLLKKDKFYEAGGFDETIRYCEDYDLWIRLSKICNIVKIEAPMFYYNRNSSTLSRSLLNMTDSCIKILEKNYLHETDKNLRRIYRKSIQFEYVKGAYRSLLINNKNKAAEYFCSSIKLNESSLYTIISVFGSIAPNIIIHIGKKFAGLNK